MSEPIIPGAGWGNVYLGARAEDLRSALGPPAAEKAYPGQGVSIWDWHDRGLQAVFDDTDCVSSLVFFGRDPSHASMKAFDGHVADGLAFGDDTARAVAALGEPYDRRTNERGAIVETALLYDGMTVALVDDHVVRVVVGWPIGSAGWNRPSKTVRTLVEALTRTSGRPNEAPAWLADILEAILPPDLRAIAEVLAYHYSPIYLGTWSVGLTNEETAREIVAAADGDANEHTHLLGFASDGGGHVQLVVGWEPRSTVTALVKCDDEYGTVEYEGSIASWLDDLVYDDHQLERDDGALTALKTALGID